MKSLEVDLSQFNLLQRLSCVESYLLYILNSNNYAYKHLYAHSYVNFSVIMNYFFNNNKLYEYYDGVERLQKIASKYNVITIERVENTQMDIRDTNSYYLLKLTRDYIKNTYGKSIWRDDHYVLLTNVDEFYYTYINDTPRDCKSLTHNEMLSAYDNCFLKINLVGDISDQTKNALLNNFLVSISEEKIEYVVTPIDNIIAIRNALTVLRILRRRIYEYCSHYICCTFMEDYLNELDMQFSMIEYMRLRNKIDYTQIKNTLLVLQEKDSQIFKTITERMCKVYG